MPPQYDFIAKIYSLTFEEGGRMTPFRSGYRPSIMLRGHLYDVVVLFGDRDEIAGGENAVVGMSLFSPEKQKGKLYVGLRFTIQEASRVVGRGEIVTLFNESLIGIPPGE